MTHAQHSRQAAIYRRESRQHRMPVHSFNAAGDLVIEYPNKTYTITREGLIR